MSSTKYDPSSSWKKNAFAKLIWHRGGGHGWGDSPSKQSIFNQVKPQSCSAGLCGCADNAKISGLREAVADNASATATLSSLTGSARDVRDEVIAASAVSLQQVEALVKLAEDVSGRIANGHSRASKAHSDALRVATVERLTR